MEAFKLMRELKTNFEQESIYLPREKGLNLLETTLESDTQISAKCRDAKVEDLWSLTSFFGYSTQTFAQAVNLLDRFLAMMKIQPKHLSCITISCLHIASKLVEEECNVASSHDLIRISQCKFSSSDLARMEGVISEKLNFQCKAVTAFTFLHLYHEMTLLHTSERKTSLSLDKLEVQLKACLCRIVFSKAKPSVLALSLLAQEIEAIQSEDMLEISQCIQRHLKIADGELLYWRKLVAKCMADYSSPECSKPDNKKLVWILSRRTAQNLQRSYCSVPELPTIPEGGWDDSSSEDSCEDMSCGEDSLSSDSEVPSSSPHFHQRPSAPHSHADAAYLGAMGHY